MNSLPDAVLGRTFEWLEPAFTFRTARRVSRGWRRVSERDGKLWRAFADRDHMRGAGPFEVLRSTRVGVFTAELLSNFARQRRFAALWRPDSPPPDVLGIPDIPDAVPRALLLGDDALIQREPIPPRVRRRLVGSEAGGFFELYAAYFATRRMVERDAPTLLLRELRVRRVADWGWLWICRIRPFVAIAWAVLILVQAALLGAPLDDAESANHHDQARTNWVRALAPVWAGLLLNTACLVAVGRLYIFRWRMRRRSQRILERHAQMRERPATEALRRRSVDLWGEFPFDRPPPPNEPAGYKLMAGLFFAQSLSLFLAALSLALSHGGRAVYAAPFLFTPSVAVRIFIPKTVAAEWRTQMTLWLVSAFELTLQLAVPSPVLLLMLFVAILPIPAFAACGANLPCPFCSPCAPPIFCTVRLLAVFSIWAALFVAFAKLAIPSLLVPWTPIVLLAGIALATLTLSHAVLLFAT